MKAFRPYLLTYLRYLHIAAFKTYANLRGEIEKTYIGCLWWIIEPLLNTAVFYIVFTRFLHIRTENFTLFLYVGMVVYGYFSNTIQSGANAIISHAGLIQQVYLPKWLFVVISVSNLTWKFLFSLIVLFPLLWFNHAAVTWAYLSLPFLILLQFWLVVGLSLPLAGLIPYFQDGRTILSTILGIGMWFSGVLYSADKVPAALRPYFYLNPVAGMIESMRRVLIDGRWPEPGRIGMLLLTGAVFWAAGLLLFQRIDRRIAKVAL